MRWGDGMHDKNNIGSLVSWVYWVMYRLNSFPSRPPMSPARTRTMLSALFADQQPSQTFCKAPIRPLAKTPRQKVRGSAAPRESCIAPVLWNDANWRRMVNEFFLREINAHRCMRSNLSRGLSVCHEDVEARGL